MAWTREFNKKIYNKKVYKFERSEAYSQNFLRRFFVTFYFIKLDSQNTRMNDAPEYFLTKKQHLAHYFKNVHKNIF